MSRTSASTDCAIFNFFFSTLGGIDLYLSPDNCCAWNPKKVQCDSDNRITWISLENLQLDGSISTALGYLPNLKFLSLHNNKLIGMIPDVFSSLPSLSYLTLFNNQQLEGSIPESLGKLPLLSTLDLTGTNISGPLPLSLASNSKLVSINNGCPYNTQNYCLPLINGIAPVLGQCKNSEWATDCSKYVSPVIITSTTSSSSPTSAIASSNIAVQTVSTTPNNQVDNNNEGNILPSDPITTVTDSNSGSNAGAKPLNSTSTLILVCAGVLLSFAFLGLSVYYGTKWRRGKQKETSEVNYSARRKELEDEGHIFPESNVTFISPVITASSSMETAKSYFSRTKPAYPQFPAGIYSSHAHHEPASFMDPNNTHMLMENTSLPTRVSLNHAQALDYSGDYVFDPATNQYYPIKRVDSFQEASSSSYDPARDC